MSESTETKEISMVCIRCGHLNDERTSRCGQCKSPLDDFASTSPWEMGKVTESAYSTPPAPRVKPIVFWGVWMYFGPTAFGAVFFLFDVAKEHIGNSNLSEMLSLGSIILYLFMILYAAVSFWVLWSVTKGYLPKK